MRGFLIFDDHVRRHDATDEPFPGVGVVDRFERADESGARTASAGTLDELVSQLADWGVDPDALRRTLEAYAAAVAQKDLLSAGVPVAPEARPPQTPPFHAVEVQPAITFTFGGIRTSLDGEVLDHDGRPIAGLYAAGADAGGVSHGGYAGGLAPCFITGTWAGRHAAHTAAAARGVS